MKLVKKIINFTKIFNSVVEKLGNSQSVLELLRETKRVYRQRGLVGTLQAAKRFIRLRISHYEIITYNLIKCEEPSQIAEISEGIPECVAPKVSVIISVYNNLRFTSHCIKSIIESSPKNSYEIIIADDGSDDETLQWCSKVKNLKHIITGKQQGFIMNNNIAATHARGEFIAFLNNDTLVRAGWLDNLVDTFDKHTNVGLVGSKLLYPDGILQEAGGIVWKDGSAWNFGRNQNPNNPEFNYTRDVDYCSAAAVMIEKSFFNKLGGFDRKYIPAYYEDTDLAFRVRAKGKRVMYQPNAQVVHFEGKSNGTQTSEGIKKYQQINAKQFFETWKKTLQNHGVNGEYVDKVKDRYKSMRALFIDAITPTPDRDSGSIDAFNTMIMLREMGFQVTFAPVSNFLFCKPYTENLQFEGIEVLHAPFTQNLINHLRSSNNRYDLVFACRYNILESNYSNIKKYCKNAKIIFHTVDLHYLRLQREADLFKNINLIRIADETKKIELDLIKKSDIATVVSDVEEEILRESVQPFNVRKLPYTRKIRGRNASYQERSGIIFVGSYQHPPNIDAVLFFTKEVLPLVHKFLPEVVFNIVGADPPREIQALENPGIIVHGHVKNLESLMDKMRLSVAPLRYGAGIKGKVGQSLGSGVPVVATKLAAEGMGLKHNEEILIAHEPSEIAKYIFEAYTNKDLWEKLSNQGIRAAESKYGFKKGYSNLSQILNELGFENIPTLSEWSKLSVSG